MFKLFQKNTDLYRKQQKQQKKNSIDMDVLYKTPIKPKRDETAKYQKYNDNIIHEADLLFMPNDKNMKYALIVTDLGSKMTDIQALRTKNSTSIINAFKKIYSRNILSVPKNIKTDSGSEFLNGEVKEYFKNLGVSQSNGRVGYHNDTAVVERKNQMIGALIHKALTKKDLENGKNNKAWLQYRHPVIKTINQQAQLTKKKQEQQELKKPVEDIILGADKNNNIKTLEKGQKVLVALQYPQDASGLRLHGKFRSSDRRWEAEPSTITEVILRPNAPVFYKVSGHKGVLNGYQLQTI